MNGAPGPSLTSDHKMTLRIRQKDICCHIGHAFITLFAANILWLPIWGLCGLKAASNNTAPQCTICGGVPQPPPSGTSPAATTAARQLPIRTYRSDSRILKLNKAVVGEVYDFATQKWVPTYKDETA
jgi:hypothetical protein